MAARIRSAEASGSLREQRHDRPGRRPDIGGVDPAVGADEAVMGLGDDHAIGHPDDPLGLAQHDLDLARIAVVPPREFLGDRARLDGREVDDRALGLRDDLLGDDQRVVVAQREDVARCREGVGDQAGRSSPGTISPRPSIAIASIRSATDRLRGLLLVEQQVVGRVEVVGRADRPDR